MSSEQTPSDTRQAGFTLVELLVSMSIMIVLMAVTLSAVTISSKAVGTSTDVQGLNEEARQAINRMARDLRQANAIVAAVNPDGPLFNVNGVVAVRLTADFDGDGCIDGVLVAACSAVAPLPYSAGNPEDLTYCYEPSSRQLYVIDNYPTAPALTSCAGGQPLLAGNVGSFTVQYRSNQYRYDVNPGDGVTTWRELDQAAMPVGNNNGQLDVELVDIDSVVLTLTMRLDNHPQVYRTQVDLRNRSQ